ncbi:MAG: hypothetical protein UX80_C0019G0008 [Candidatus Amesbacteria bacterium GW2011_GWA2_47_11b]|uniref:Uncharacterized protein n=3 Tax=Candidatus Amesiibacteriota TaxID=1752730 RepID=A0A0G1SI96_9BACT|nr:MAG: hypothetical protein UX42_C0003G0076 [Microgenomates group bacterium GW2011_GWC1_46_20]KKU57316.1 MAG: hypothetical protein UX80_C0019G0008 [Candidatus Amesbacteria bacterium GW2011_GWA2_47_11b]KKU69159.1 MAG: hypothetical protein UX92_C0014G0050 [Candidatus Amesbacteria bacterium GW2011_GWA1_47_20]KKU83426.1 MAG: hypothetical protein UY11_C0020G0008 [Candidatus Amesbacteria bacterium GW2011_GWC2_47_8]
MAPNHHLLALTFNDYPPLEGIGPLGTAICDPALRKCNIALALDKFDTILSVTVGVMTVVAGIWFIIQVFTASIEWLSSGGEKQHLQNAQKKLTHSFIGLFLVVAAYGIIIALGRIVGLDLLINPTKIIVWLTP